MLRVNAELSARPDETVESDDTEVPAGAGSTRSSLLLLYWSKHLAATGRVEKEHSPVCWRWSSRGGTNAALVETLGFIGVSAL
jgi:hypothetical protein